MPYTFISSLIFSFLLSVPLLALDVPPLSGRIVDLDHLLPSDVAASLSSELEAHERKTGNQVVVLTLPSLEGESLEEYSHRVATTWKLGQKGTDNGVLLLIVPGERRVRIEAGYGLEGVLTDARSAQIIRHEIVPRFRAGDFAGGVTAGAKAIMGTIEGSYVAPQAQPRRAPSNGAVESLFIAILIGAFVGGALMGGRLKALGGIVSGVLSFLIALPTGLVMAVIAAVLGILGALVMTLLSSGVRSGRGRTGWDGGWGGGFGGGGGISSSDTFSGGGGDLGGGGASGRW